MMTTILTMTMLTAMTILTMTMLNRWMSADVVCAEGEDKKTTLEKAPLSLYQLHVLRPYTCYTCYTYCAYYYGDAREGAALTILATRSTLAIFTALTTATLEIGAALQLRAQQACYTYYGHTYYGSAPYFGELRAQQACYTYYGHTYYGSAPYLESFDWQQAAAGDLHSQGAALLARGGVPGAGAQGIGQRAARQALRTSRDQAP
eukprot:scaffold66533_cov51-Phaeocystis_antarctica.AAC.1